jgi:hypothetical protein
MRKTPLSQSRPHGKLAFFSFDAALAMLVAALSLASFSFLLSYHAASARDFADSESSSLLALRMSSAVISQCEMRGGAAFAGEYARAWELDKEKFALLDIGSLAGESGATYASADISYGAQSILSRSWGQPNGAVFCSKRLVIMDGAFALLRVCVS